MRLFGIVALAGLAGCARCEVDNCGFDTVDSTPELPVVPPPVEPEPGMAVERHVLGRPQIDVLYVVDSSLDTDPDDLFEVVDDIDLLWDVVLREGVDLHLGVLDASPERPIGTIAGWTADAGDDFREMFLAVRPGDRESGYGRLAAYASFELVDRLNTGFARVDATRHLVFVAGKDDLSVQPFEAEFTAWVTEAPLRGGTAHAIVPASAATYRGYAEATGGQWRTLGIPERDSLDFESLVGDPLPPRTFLSGRPADLHSIEVTLLGDKNAFRPATVCVPDPMPDPLWASGSAEGCSAVYEPGTNALRWLRRFDAVHTAQIRYRVDPAR